MINKEKNSPTLQSGTVFQNGSTLELHFFSQCTKLSHLQHFFGKFGKTAPPLEPFLKVVSLHRVEPFFLKLVQFWSHFFPQEPFLLPLSWGSCQRIWQSITPTILRWRAENQRLLYDEIWLKRVYVCLALYYSFLCVWHQGLCCL